MAAIMPTERGDIFSWLQTNAIHLGLPAVAFGLMVAYYPGWTSPAVAPRWILLSLAVPILSIWCPIPNTRLLLLWSGTVTWVICTLLWTPSPWDGLWALWILLLAFGIWTLGAGQASLQAVWKAASLGLALALPLVVAQAFGSTIVSQVAPPAGLMLNRNFLGEASALILVACLAHRRWLWAIAPALTLPLTLCRGAILGTGVALLVMLGRAKPMLALWLALVSTNGAVIAYSSGYFGNHYSIGERLDIWRDTLGALSPFGAGAGSFYVQYPAINTRTDTLATRPQHAHNDFLEAAYTLGIGAVGIFALLGIALHRGLKRNTPESYVLLAFCVEACFQFPSAIPTTAFFAWLCAGHVSVRRNDSSGLHVVG